MRTETISFGLYRYNELSNEAKGKVKEWYLDGEIRNEEFCEMCEQDIHMGFPNNVGKLEIQYRLVSCQGDGFNIYGTIDEKSIFEYLNAHADKYGKPLTVKEQKTILHYGDVCGLIQIPMNNRYTYCMAEHIDIADSWKWNLMYDGYRDIKSDTLKKFEKIVIKIFKDLCKDFENFGYQYLYEVEEDELEDFCETNECEFFEDGTFYAA